MIIMFIKTHKTIFDKPPRQRHNRIFFDHYMRLRLEMEPDEIKSFVY